MMIYVSPCYEKMVSNSSDPGTPSEGWIWYNTTDHELKYQADTSTMQVTASED